MTPRLPAGMTEATWQRIARLPGDRRNRVLERACLIFYGGAAATIGEADEMALAAEGFGTQQTMNITDGETT